MIPSLQYYGTGLPMAALTHSLCVVLKVQPSKMCTVLVIHIHRGSFNGRNFYRFCVCQPQKFPY